MRSGIITLLTDFGTQDPFVGVMKGVMLGIARDCTFVDLTHDVPAQYIHVGMFLLGNAFQYFPEGTVHLAVVDPGVGSQRKGMAASAHGHFFVGPDNGLLTEVITSSDTFSAVYLEESTFFRHPVSSSFHGRDIFAPVAAAIAQGASLETLGPPCEEPCLLATREPIVSRDSLLGQVIHVDRFGNLITNIPHDLFARHMALLSCTVQIADTSIEGITPYYSAVSPGDILATFTSFGRLEIAQRDGNAMRALKASLGTPVTVSRVQIDESSL